MNAPYSLLSRFSRLSRLSRFILHCALLTANCSLMRADSGEPAAMEIQSVFVPGRARGSGNTECICAGTSSRQRKYRVYLCRDELAAAEIQSVFVPGRARGSGNTECICAGTGSRERANESFFSRDGLAGARQRVVFWQRRAHSMNNYQLAMEDNRERHENTRQNSAMHCRAFRFAACNAP
jgi:hypothetical protein